jgi:hypothetical protein
MVEDEGLPTAAMHRTIDRSIMDNYELLQQLCYLVVAFILERLKDRNTKPESTDQQIASEEY